MLELVVVVKPVARGADRAVDAVLRAAVAAGLDARVVPTSVAEPGGPQARDAVAAGAAGVVVIGGDGTVRAVAEQLAGTRVPLGIVPRGTANLFARNLGLPRDARAASVAVAGAPTPTDLGRARLERADGRVDEEPFLIVVGAGHDALTIEAASLRAKDRLGWPAYVAAGVGRMRLPGFRVRGTFDGASARAQPWSVLVHSAAELPAGLRVVPGTSLRDGRLHVVAVSPRRPRDWVRIAASGAGIGRAAGVLGTRVVRRVVLEGLDDLLPVQIDGDPMGRAVRIHAEVRPGSLLVRT